MNFNRSMRFIDLSRYRKTIGSWYRVLRCRFVQPCSGIGYTLNKLTRFVLLWKFVIVASSHNCATKKFTEMERQRKRASRCLLLILESTHDFIAKFNYSLRMLISRLIILNYISASFRNNEFDAPKCYIICTIFNTM